MIKNKNLLLLTLIRTEEPTLIRTEEPQIHQLNAKLHNTTQKLMSENNRKFKRIISKGYATSFC